MTMSHALNLITEEGSKPTERTMERIEKLLDSMHTNLNAVVSYHASNKSLNIHLDASYLLAGRGKSCAGGYFFS